MIPLCDQSDIWGKVGDSFEMKPFIAYEWMTGIVTVNKEFYEMMLKQ